MDAELLERAKAGLMSWQRGDISALESLLDPEVELLWWEPGVWDCHGRQAVLSLLRERRTQGADWAEVELIEAGDDVLVVSRGTVEDAPQPIARPATVVRFRNGRVVSMRQFRSSEEALAAAG